MKSIKIIRNKEIERHMPILEIILLGVCFLILDEILISSYITELIYFLSSLALTIDFFIYHKKGTVKKSKHLFIRCIPITLVIIIIEITLHLYVIEHSINQYILPVSSFSFLLVCTYFIQKRYLKYKNIIRHLEKINKFSIQKLYYSLQVAFTSPNLFLKNNDKKKISIALILSSAGLMKIIEKNNPKILFHITFIGGQILLFLCFIFFFGLIFDLVFFHLVVKKQFKESQ